MGGGHQLVTCRKENVSSWVKSRSLAPLTPSVPVGTTGPHSAPLGMTTKGEGQTCEERQKHHTNEFTATGN
jgi:hypothetical protein